MATNDVEPVSVETVEDVPPRTGGPGEGFPRDNWRFTVIDDARREGVVKRVELPSAAAATSYRAWIVGRVASGVDGFAGVRAFQRGKVNVYIEVG